MRGVDPLAGSISVDPQALDRLRLEARRDPAAAGASVAREFETMFVDSLLKSMRQANLDTGLLDNDETRYYTSLLDRELAKTLAEKGVGLADRLLAQLLPSAEHTAPSAPSAAAPFPLRAPPAPPLPAPAPTANAPATPLTAPGAPRALPAGRGNVVREFVDRVMPHALEVSRASGIPADFMVGQAALESGWGRREIRTGDGSPSYNIFGIKAGRSWSGPTVERSTLEYIDGVPRRVNQRFRAYDSYAAAFQDYARLLQTNRRYAAALNTSDDPARFAQALQDAGYATDPQYANKLTRVINGAQFRQATVSYAALAAAKPA